MLHVERSIVLLVTTISVVALCVVGSYLYRKRKSYKNAPPKKWELVANIKQLYLYPLKSGKGQEIKKAECTVFGIQMSKEEDSVMQLRDRCLVVYGDIDKEYKTAITYPILFLVEVSVHDTDHIAVDAPGMRTLYINIPKVVEQHAQEHAIFWKNEKIATLNCGVEAASWISRYILQKDSGLSIGFHEGKQRRNVTDTHKEYLKTYRNLSNESTGMYSDLASFLLVNQASIDDLADKLQDGSVSARNFRPNILVEGEKALPFNEDKWDWIKIGDAVFRNVKFCTRCTMPTIDPDSAVRFQNGEPLKTLKSYRQLRNLENIELEGSAPVMGIYMGLIQPGSIGVGDAVYIGTNN